MNPFSYGTVVKYPYFFDREDELKRIVETLKGGNNLVLYAPRRYGKTSLVMKAIEKLKNQGYQCIYFDFMVVYSTESFIESYSKAILSEQKQWQKALKKFSSLIKSIKPSVNFDNEGNPKFSIEFLESKESDSTLESVIDLPERLAETKSPIIIIMDEFQDVQKINGNNFQDILRSKIQHHENINYLFLGSRTHILTDMFSNKNRPFYNSAMTMKIGTLPFHDTIKFLINRFSESAIKLNKSNATYLIEKAGNIPYYIQFLASEVWQDTVNTSNPITRGLIDKNTDRIIELKKDYYFEMFDRCSAYQKKLLKALATCGTNIYSKEYANKFRLSATSTTQKAIKSLIDKGITEKHENEYLYSDPFFKTYVLRLQA